MDGTRDTIDKTIDKKLSEAGKAILEALARNPSMTQKELAAHLNLSEIGVRYNTDKLKKNGLLKRAGGKKTGHWEVQSR